MPRTRRVTPAGVVFHVLNRATGRARIFSTDGDYHAFLKVLDEAVERSDMRVLAYSILPNHWHIVEWPNRDGQVSSFMSWLTNTHAQRYQAAHGIVGSGHLYQGRFKSFPVQSDDHLLAVIRYVERNALTAGLVDRAEDWRWSSLWVRSHALDTGLCEWPVGRLEDWIELVNRPLSRKEQGNIGRSIAKGCPYGAPDWKVDTVALLNLESTTRGPGRPKKRMFEKSKKGS